MGPFSTTTSITASNAHAGLMLDTRISLGISIAVHPIRLPYVLVDGTRTREEQA